jgi:hypothetical protein
VAPRAVGEPAECAIEGDVAPKVDVAFQCGAKPANPGICRVLKAAPVSKRPGESCAEASAERNRTEAITTEVVEVRKRISELLRRTACMAAFSWCLARLLHRA